MIIKKSECIYEMAGDFVENKLNIALEVNEEVRISRTAIDINYVDEEFMEAFDKMFFTASRMGVDLIFKKLPAENYEVRLTP